MLGENNPSWNKDLSDEDRIHKRISEELKKWKNTVLERDNYTCQITGKRGGNLNVHHLNSYHWDKENRTNTDNGITLSKGIHLACFYLEQQIKSGNVEINAAGLITKNNR